MKHDLLDLLILIFGTKHAREALFERDKSRRLQQALHRYHR